MDALYSNVLRSLELEGEIRAEIRAGGPIPFARFMELALYHRTLGYYRAGGAPMTRTGDYLTAPETHPVFGALLARFVRAAAVALSPSEARVVEQGAGTGALARSFLAYWQAAWPSAPLSYTIVEPHDAARDALNATLPGVATAASLHEIAPFDGVYLSNELPDAFPVHRLRRRGGSLVEVYVALRGDDFTEVEGPLSGPEVERAWEAAGIALAEGHEIEVNTGLRPWMSEVSAALRRGYLLTLDYGYEAAESERFPRGTLLAHYRHTTNEDFHERIGRQDLTAHICWTALERHAEAAGLQNLERVSQREFLTRWGWKDFGRYLLARPSTNPIELDAVDRLGRPDDGLGNLGALLQSKGGLPPPRPSDAGPPRWEAVGG